MTAISNQNLDLDNNLFIKEMSEKLLHSDEIPTDLYTKYNVKRGLRNANGTGVLVGLTRVSNVEGYTVNEKKEKIAIPGKLYYRGFDVEDIVNSFIDESRF